MEEWRDIKGFEGLYQVSDLGRVRDIRRNKEKATRHNPKGYVIVDLKKDGKKTTQYIHRLVAIAFISNPHDYPQINHKDENKSNNVVDNLEWCTQKYNNNYGTHNQRISETKKGMKLSDETRKKISIANSGVNHWNYGNKWSNEVIEKNKNSQKTSRKVRHIETGMIYRSIAEASRQLNMSGTMIGDICHGKYKQCFGNHFEFVE